MNRAFLQRNIAQSIRLLRRKSVNATVLRHKHQIFELPARVAEREIFLLKYACAACNHDNEEILLASMFQTNLVMVNCSNCGGRHALAEQLDWYREIASQNPLLIEELRNEGKLADGLVVADFETKLKESKDKKKLMLEDEATDYVAVAYNEDTAVAEAKVSLLLITDQN